MNQRIQELWLQAGGHYNGGNQHAWPEYTIADLEKFAQLLVGECARHIIDQQALVETNWQCRDGIHIVYSLKEHFGVEP